MIIGSINTKGGVGKSTIALSLGVSLAQSGADVLLVDTDLQQSLSKWSTIRDGQERKPVITCMAKAGKVGSDIIKMQSKFDYIIVDAGGRDSMELRQTMSICDKIVIPVRPAAFDSWEIGEMVGIITEIERAAEKRLNAMVVLNAVSTNLKNKDAEDTRNFLLGDESWMKKFTVLNTTIGERVAFSRAARTGGSVTELKNNDFDMKANSEITNLLREILDEPFNLR